MVVMLGLECGECGECTMKINWKNFIILVVEFAEVSFAVFKELRQIFVFSFNSAIMEIHVLCGEFKFSWWILPK